jgi:hypothetical protein
MLPVLKLHQVRTADPHTRRRSEASDGGEGREKGRGSSDVPNSDFVLLTGGVHQAWGPHVSDRTSGALQGWHVRVSVSREKVIKCDHASSRAGPCHLAVGPHFRGPQRRHGFLWCLTERPTTHRFLWCLTANQEADHPPTYVPPMVP